MADRVSAFSAHCVTIRDPFHPLRHREVVRLDGPGPISALAPATTQPFLIMRNGEAVLRKDWDQPVSDGDLMAVVLLPQGGRGGSDVLKIVLMVVIAIYAPMLGAELATATGIGTASTWGAVVGLAGSMLVNAILPPQAAANPGTGNTKAASPTYNLTAQGNQARIGAAIPIQYGRLLSYPDFAAAPYVEYQGNEQYLYQLLCIGVGEYDIEQIRIEDTDIGNFEEVQYEIVGPNETLDLFPAAVVTAGEVAGQELIYNTAIGPFVSNNAGTTATRLAVDVVLPRGLYHLTNSGNLSNRTITFTAEARQINDDGAAIGSWFTLGEETIEAATSTPQRLSYNYTVTAGRYEVKVTRTSEKDEDTSTANDIIWAGLRAYLVSDSTFGNVTLLAVRIRATNNLSQQSARKINVIATRKLYYWNGAAWAGPLATRSVAWALADACKTVGIPDNRMDLDGLLALEATLAARGDTFNGRFDNTSTFWDALTKIALVGRAKPFKQAGIVHFRRDEAVSLPVAMYSMRNIIRGSFSIEFLTPTDETADAVEVTYFDETTWKFRTLLCKLPDSTAERPAKIEYFGATNRQQAYEYGIYMAAANRYRRMPISFQTEMEGFIPSFGDLVAVSHDMPQWGQGADVVEWDEDTLTMTLSEPMVFVGTGNHYAGLRRRDGSVSGPYVVRAGAAEDRIVFTVPLDFTPYTGQDEERTHLIFGPGEAWYQPARVLAIRPKDEYTVELICINEDPSVHTAELGLVAPAINHSQLPATPKAPTVSGLIARSAPGQPDKMVISWRPSPGVERYLVEQSADGIVWTRVGDTTANNYTGQALYGAQTKVRVAAIGALRGSWASINYALESDYMWSANAATLMWSSDTNLMWS
jgi:hypothetical protein